MDEAAIFRAWAECDENGIPGNPWGIEADLLHREDGKDIIECIDYVILLHLYQGDARPIAKIFEMGAAPGRNILIVISKMLIPGTSTIDENLPYKFDVKRKSGKGRPLDMDVAVRDMLIARMVEELGRAVLMPSSPQWATI